MRNSRGVLGFLLWACVPATLIAGDPKQLGDVGSFAKWTAIEIEVTGPSSHGTGDPNPFAELVDFTFTGPGGQTYVVPGFYDGDGNGGLDGSVWKVRFSADQTGSWTFSSTSSDGELDGYTGSFSVTPAPAGAPEFYRWGRLEAVGTPANQIRYLKFRDGPYWLKAGSDDPENFLGSLSNYDTEQERMAAIDYLAAKGVNSLYVMTHNVGGDDQDVWPWLGSTPAEARDNGGANARFDVAKLAEWRAVFERMQSKGMVTYVILEDDSAWTGYDHDRYYRELVARFGDLPGLLWNIGEEHVENYSTTQALAFAGSLKAIDPYDHPIGIHHVNDPSNQYIDSSHVDFTSIQTFGTDSWGSGPLHNGITIDWINACTARGARVLMVNFDEPRPLMFRAGFWGAYLGGGVWEQHVDSPYDRPMTAWDVHWTTIGGARRFMESLPFWEMQPANELVTSGNAFALARPGVAYGIYLPNGVTSVTVTLTPGTTYEYSWWNPIDPDGWDGSFLPGATVDGGSRTFTAPDPCGARSIHPNTNDCALRIVAQSAGGNSPPIASGGLVQVAAGESAAVTLAYTDPDGPGPYVCTITTPPTEGSLSGTGCSRTYTPSIGAAASDGFRWRVNDGLANSNEAFVSIEIIGGNAPPTASNQQVSTGQGTPVLVSLAWADSDGPGPYEFSITSPPANGSVVEDSPGSNDFLYTPNAGFAGSDSFRWKVNDGLADSAEATATITVSGGPPAPPTGLQLE